MKKSQGIRSVESKAGFREKLVENFVQKNLPPKTINPNKLSGMGIFADRYKAIESCAAETPVTGNVELFLSPTLLKAARILRVPARSRFFVFCTRDDRNDYKVTWSSSLS